MSSFIGHGLAALTIGKIFDLDVKFEPKNLWFVFLIFCAIAPDVDYLIPVLNKVNNGDLRITHSVGFCLFLPFLAMLLLSIFNTKYYLTCGLSAFLAGLSHLVLDSLVGSRQFDPLLYPLTIEKIGLPFGLLPSAGSISYSNYYFYRNLLIELGILIPLFYLILVGLKRVRFNKILLVGLTLTFLIFLTWSINLTR